MTTGVGGGTSEPDLTSSILCRSQWLPPWNTRALAPLAAAFRPVGALLSKPGLGRSASPMGEIALPPFVLCSSPLEVCTSNSGFFCVKYAGLPQPA